jgi:pentatricopeptide repeat protein
MSALVAMLMAVSQPDLLQSPGSIANQYKAIIQEYKQNLSASGKTRELGSRTAASIHRQLQTLLDNAEQTDTAMLEMDDLIALSESAERLKQSEKAVSYARLAAERADDIKAYVTLVRCLCAVGRTDEAEKVVCDANAKFSGAEKQYLPHNILALKYRGLKEYDKAYQHMDRTVALLLTQTNRAPFYVAHLARCLDDLWELATQVGRAQEFALKLEKMRAQMIDQLGDRLGQPQAGSNALQLTPDALLFNRLARQTLLVVEERLANGHPEGVLNDWLESLTNCKRSGNDIDAPWQAEVHLFLAQFNRSLAPSFTGTAIERRLTDIAAQLKRMETNATTTTEAQALLIDELNRTLGIVKQHHRHRELVGRRLNLDNPSNESSEDADHCFLLVHVIDPTAKLTRQGLQSISSPVFKRAEMSQVKIRFMASQVGLAWDSQKRRFYRFADQSAEEERDALAEFQRAARIPEKIYLLPKDSREAQLLRVEHFPVNILLDPDGKVVAILTGPEPEKLRALVKLIPPPPSSP